MANAIWRRAILLTLISSLCAAIALWSIFRLELHNKLQETENFEQHTVTLLSDLIHNEIEHIFADLYAFSEHHELEKYIQDPSTEILVDLFNDWSSIQEQRKLYDQIRYIDKNGQEQIRLNYVNGRPVLVTNEQLQNKSGRYYFEESFLLKPGERYVSPLDLNIEHGEIEKPFKPMIRVGTPVVDNNRVKHGVVIINVLAKVILDQVKTRQKEFSQGDAMLVNEEGFWLIHPEPTKEWGFMLNKDERIGFDFPEVWAVINSKDKGQIHTDSGLFTFISISTLPSAVSSPGDSHGKNEDVLQSPPSWTLISFVSSNLLATQLKTLKTNLTIVWFCLSAIAVFVSFKVSVLIDSRQRAFDTIERRERMIKLILNSTEEGIYGVDKDGLCTFFNKSAEDLLGYVERETLGKDTHNLLVQLRSDGTIVKNEPCCAKDVMKSGMPCNNDDGILMKKNGGLLNVSYHIHPIKSEGSIQGAVITFTDISEKKKLIAQRIRSGQLSSLGELAAGVAHEINNPITGVINYTQLLMNKSSAASYEHKILSSIIKESNRIAVIVRNLLKFAYKDDSKMQPINVEEIISDSVELLKSQIENDGIDLDVSVEGDLPRVFGNLQKLEQVMLNLISNARHALNEKVPDDEFNKTLKISAKRIKSGSNLQVQIVVHDNGAGMSSVQKEKAFNRFFTTKPAGVGTGLGLSIVHDIVEEHGALIEIESELGLYTKAILDFPVSDPT